MPRIVLHTWMTSLSNLVAFQAKRFALGAWLILVIAVTIGFISLKHETARVSQLEKTNCILKKFLTKAEIARVEAFNQDKGVLRVNDKKAILGYKELADSFVGVGHNCIVQKVPPVKWGN